ncbi:sensor histidine kinase [Microvirga sp. P5_D2]
MHDSAASTTAASSPGLLPHLRSRVVLTFTAFVLATCCIFAFVLFSRALDERHAILHRATGAASNLSFGFDQEVSAVNYLLKGLSQSPALLSGDNRAFYDQLKATPIPEDSWLVLNDMERQVINTLRPLGSTLPRHTEFANYQEQIARIRDRRWAVSGRMFGLVKGTVVVALSLRLDDPNGRMRGFLTTVLSDKRVARILSDQEVPYGWTKGVYDRKLLPIAMEQDGRTASDIPIPTALANHLANAGPDSTIEGMTEAVDQHGLPVLIAFRRSGATNWTTTVVMPLAAINAPIRSMLWQMAGPFAFLLYAGSLTALFTARQVERPIHDLSKLADHATSRVSELSEQLLALQEEERQRIARELHDSTAQHLVAANLSLAGLEGAVPQTPASRKAFGDIEEQLDEALRELRIFTYLLHPPNLAKDGLQATLRDFAEGFAGRTGLVARIRIPEEVDEIPPDLQRTILRVVQEALTNVHRHANASQVSVDARIASGRLMVRIHDNGRGMKHPGRSDGPVRLGVGIVGMRARLEQFGGNLRIRTGPGGTSIMAVLPVSIAGRALFKARHLLNPLLVRPGVDEGRRAS